MTQLSKLDIDAFNISQGSEPIMKLGLGLTLYFPRPFQNILPSLHAFWADYLSFVPPDTFTWARLGGGNRSRPATQSTFSTIDGWLSGRLDPGSTCWISLSDGELDCMGAYGFHMTAEGAIKSEYDEEAGYVDLAFPLSVIDQFGLTAFADRLIQLASHLPFYAGVAGYSFQRSPYKLDALLEPIRTLSRRFAGVEITAAERFAYLAERGIPTVNWLTFVGQTHLKKVGGIAALATALEGKSEVRPLPAGTVVISGEGPTLGDVNSPTTDLEPLRTAYAALRGAQFVDERYAIDDLDFPGNETTAWLTRLARDANIAPVRDRSLGEARREFDYLMNGDGSDH